MGCYPAQGAGENSPNHGSKSPSPTTPCRGAWGAGDGLFELLCKLLLKSFLNLCKLKGIGVGAFLSPPKHLIRARALGFEKLEADEPPTPWVDEVPPTLSAPPIPTCSFLESALS